jgi:hypothetical protein
MENTVVVHFFISTGMSARVSVQSSSEPSLKIGASHGRR